MFKRAERTKTFIKLAILGPSGSGKTYSALRLARGLVGPTGRIAFLDTENRSATLYSDLTEFDHCEIVPRVDRFDYRDFITGTLEAEKAGYDCLIIDSGSHLWQGILDEKSARDAKGGNSFTNWADSTKHFNKTIQAFLQARIHTISCIRSKTEYVLEESRNAKGCLVSVPRKIGLAPIMRDGIEYEFTTVFDVQADHTCNVSKDRTGLFVDYAPELSRTFQITEETGQQIANWLAGAKPEDVRRAIVPHTPEEPQPETTRRSLCQKPSEPVTETTDAPAAKPSKEAASDSAAPQAEVAATDRNAVVDAIKAGVIHKNNSNGIVPMDDFKAFLKTKGVEKTEELPDDALASLAERLQRFRNMKPLIDRLKMPPTKVAETVKNDGSPSLFGMTDDGMKAFEQVLVDMAAQSEKN